MTAAPSSVAMGATVTITGANFAAHAKISVFVDGQTTPIAAGSTDNVGALAAPITFAASFAAGAHQLRVIDDRSRYPVAATLTITP